MITNNSSGVQTQESWIYRTDGFHESISDQHPTTIEFAPPPSNQKWDAKLAVIYIRELTKTESVVMLLLVDHANRFRGTCFPSVPCLQYESDLPKRTVERALTGLVQKGYITRQRRGDSSSATHINWGKLKTAFEAWERRKQEWPSIRNGRRIGTVISGRSVPSQVAYEPRKVTFEGNPGHEIHSPPSAAYGAHQEKKEKERGCQKKSQKLNGVIIPFNGHSTPLQTSYFFQETPVCSSPEDGEGTPGP